MGRLRSEVPLMEFSSAEEQRVWESYQHTRARQPKPKPTAEKPIIKPLGQGAEVSVREWRVELFAAVGAVVLLAAEKGSGKTALGMRLAEAVSSGTPFLDQLQTVKGRVLYVQADECEEVTEIRRRLRCMIPPLCGGSIEFIVLVPQAVSRPSSLLTSRSLSRHSPVRLFQPQTSPVWQLSAMQSTTYGD
jgi:hypothetical protein